MRRILSGQGADGYASLAERDAARDKRHVRLSEAVDSPATSKVPPHLLEQAGGVAHGGRSSMNTANPTSEATA